MSVLRNGRPAAAGGLRPRPVRATRGPRQTPDRKWVSGRPGGIAVSHPFQSLKGANPKKPITETIGKNTPLANRIFGLAAMKNPGALAGATGANGAKKTPDVRRKNTAKQKRSAMAQFAKDAHKRVARMVGYCLTLGTDDQVTWDGLSIVFAARLTTEERVAIAFAALRSLDQHTAYLTASVVLFGTLDSEVVA